MRELHYGASSTAPKHALAVSGIIGARDDRDYNALETAN